MLEGLKQQWMEFKRARPGHRFQERYERNGHARSERSWATRYLKPLCGLVLLVVGVVFCVIPGPGLPIILIGAALLADVSRPIALALDWMEVCIRSLVSRARRGWMHASMPAKCAIVFVALLIASAAAYGCFRMVLAFRN